jgi:hypothetical protein
MVRIRGLADALGRFRAIAVQDIDAALAELASESARNDFRKFSEQLWPLTDPNVGWSYFFSFSVIGAVNSKTTQPLVAFVHPWSDVVLVTSWSADGGPPQLTGAKILPGQLLRSGTMPSPGQGPAWIVDSQFQPAVLAQHVAQSVKAFEAKYSLPRVAPWWSVAETLDSGSNTNDARIAICTALLIDSMARPQIFSEQQVGEPASLAPMRRELSRFLQLATAGSFDTLWPEATEMLPETKETLLKLPSDRFGKLVVTSALVGQNDGMVFLAPWDEPDLCLSLHLVDLGQAPRISRVDVISFQGAYQSEQERGKP